MKQIRSLLKVEGAIGLTDLVQIAVQVIIYVEHDFITDLV